MMETTFAIIKPDAVAAKNSGKIIDLIEKNNFEILGMRKLKLSKQQAEEFYKIHNQRGWFSELIDFMTSGPVVVMALAKPNAVVEWRNLMGSTNPAEAASGTIRKLYGSNIGENATHGSDSIETSKIEIAQFFPELVK